MYLTTFIIEIVIIARSHRSVRFGVMICQHVSQSVMQVDQLNNTVLFCSNSPLTSNSALVARWYFLVLFLPLSAAAHWWCVAYWLVDAFRCFSSPFQQQGFGGSGHFGVFYLHVLTLLYRLFGSVLCAAFFLLFGAFLPLAITRTLVTWCFFPTLLLNTLTLHSIK